MAPECKPFESIQKALWHITSDSLHLSQLFFDLALKIDNFHVPG
jgi:hypothetical protein